METDIYRLNSHPLRIRAPCWGGLAIRKKIAGKCRRPFSDPPGDLIDRWEHRDGRGRAPRANGSDIPFSAIPPDLRRGKGVKGSTSTKAMNGGDSLCGSDGSGWGFGSPAAVDWSVCTPCAKPFDPGPSQLSSSEFSSQQLPGSVGSGGSGWGVVFQQTPVGAGDMDLAR